MDIKGIKKRQKRQRKEDGGRRRGRDLAFWDTLQQVL